MLYYVIIYMWDRMVVMDRMDRMDRIVWIIRINRIVRIIWIISKLCW